MAHLPCRSRQPVSLVKKTLLVLVAIWLPLAGTLIAQTNPAPPAFPVLPTPGQSLTKEQQEMLRKKLEEYRRNYRITNAPALGTNAPATMIPLPLRTPAAPTIPTAQTPPAPTAPTVPPTMRPAQPTIQAPAPPSPGAPSVPAAQVQPVAGGVGPTARKTEEQSFNLNLQNQPNEHWLQVYGELVDRTILRAANLPDTKITIQTRGKLTREEAIQAFEHVLALNNLTAIKIGEKFVEIVPSAQAMQEGAAFGTKNAADLPEAAQYTTQIIQLKHVAPSDAQQAITPFAKSPNGIVAIDASQTLVLRDYSINVKRMMEVIEKIDVSTPMEVELELIPIKYALVSDIAAVLGSLTSGGTAGAPTSSATSRRSGSTTGRRSTSGRTGTSSQYGQPGIGTQPGQPGYNPMQRGTTTPGAPTSASGAVSSFQDRLRSIVQRAASGGEAPLLGDAKIIPDERTNSLLIFATKQEREMIKNIVEKLDVVQAQVLIEAIIVEVTLSDSLSAGVSMSQNHQRANRFNGAVGSQQNSAFPFSFIDPKSVNSLTNFPGGFNYFGSVGRDFDFVVAAAAGDSRVNILSRPRIQTSHAVEAELFDGESRPFPMGTYQTYGGLNQTQTQQQQIGIRLNILPLINQDGLVVLDISQTVQSLGAEIQIDANFSVPSVIDRQASSRVAVKNGDTIILGGMIRNEKRNTRSGVPYLKDIPLLGKLFSSKATEDSKRELIVFIRPTVLPTPEVAASFATEETDKLIDVKQAQHDMMRDEAKRRQKMQEDLLKQLEEDQRRPRK